MPSGVHPVLHVYEDIETIAYLLEGVCSVFHEQKCLNYSELGIKKAETISMKIRRTIKQERRI